MPDKSDIAEEKPAIVFVSSNEPNTSGFPDITSCPTLKSVHKLSEYGVITVKVVDPIPTVPIKLPTVVSPTSCVIG